MDLPDPGVLTVVDPHVHMFDMATGLYPRRATERDRYSRGGSYLVEDLLADAGPIRIERAVHVEAFPLDGLAEARNVQRLAGTVPGGTVLSGTVAYADLSSAGVAEDLDALVGVPMVRGIRQVLDRWVPRPRTNERDLTADPDWWRGFGLLHRYGLSFDLQVRPDQHEPVADRLADCPETMVVLNHIGAFSERSYPNWRLWRRGLRKLADRPNTWIKISGPGMYDDAPTVESVRPYVFEALETFGWERAMFASNFPVDKRSIDYPALWAIFARSVASLPDTQQSALLRDNASRFYRL